MTSKPRIRVLVVDDSAFARKVLRESLSASPEIDVVGIARDGLDALERISELKPDVITLDLMMPNLDGLGVLRGLSALPDAPAVVVVSTLDESSELGIAALVAGAFELVHKPTALALDRLYELGEELVRKVIAAGTARKRFHVAKTPSEARLLRAAVARRTAMVVVGASTGGPHAISALLRALPKDFPVPMAIVVHLPPGYTEAFARRLDGDCELDVVEAQDDLCLVAGTVVIARAGFHLRICPDAGGWKAGLNLAPADSLHRPSVDVLFESAAEHVGSGALGVVLTGMGNDGLNGSRAIHAAGGRILTEAESSSVVYGMPRCVFEDGIALQQVPLEGMLEAILEQL